MALAVCSIFASCGHNLAPLGHYQSTPVVADGQLNDWKQPLRFNYPNYPIQYNITSDEKALYICVATGDEETQLRMLRSGLTIWLDPKGEKNKTIGLFFPIRKQPEPSQYRSRGSYADGSGDYAGRGGTGGGRAVNTGTRKAELLLQSNYYNTTGFLNMENGQFGITDTSSPIRLAIKNEDRDSLLVYEVVIPLRNLVGPNWMAKAAKNQVSINLALNSTPGTGGGYRGGRPAGGGIGIRGMGGMRGMGGGRRYGGGGGSNPGQKEEDSWYTFRLPLTK